MTAAPLDLQAAEALIQGGLVWDAHAGVFPSPETDLSGVAAWREAGVDFVSLNVGFDVMGWADTIATLSRYRATLGAMPQTVSLVRTLADVDAARAAGTLAVAFDIEGANALNNDLGMVSVYHDLGVRQMLLAYNLGNAASGGCHDADAGLTAFGRDVVREMQRVGMTVDLSHMSRQASLDAAALAEKPMVFSHSNPASLWRHQRNIDDTQIRACAETGGVIGLNGMGIFLGANEVSEEIAADHVCRIADIAGPAHVCFGLDWKPPMATAPDIGAILRSRPDYWPPGNAYDTPGLKIFAPAQLPKLVALLAARGWGEAELRGFLGENFRRVAQETWLA